MLEDRNEILKSKKSPTCMLAREESYGKRKLDTSYDFLCALADKGPNCSGSFKMHIKYIQVESFESSVRV